MRAEGVRAEVWVVCSGAAAIAVISAAIFRGGESQVWERRGMHGQRQGAGEVEHIPVPHSALVTTHVQAAHRGHTTMTEGKQLAHTVGRALLLLLWPSQASGAEHSRRC